MPLVGYARTSTFDQKAGLDAQTRDLKAAGCTKIFAEQISSMVNRPQLAACLDYIREGDTLVVTKPDRLARSTGDLLEMVKELTARKIGLLVLSMGGDRLDTRNPTSKLMLTLMAGIAEWEREIMLERQREGIQRAKAEGLYTGRQPTARAKAEQVKALAAEGKTKEAIAEALDISRASVFRILADAKAPPIDDKARTSKLQARTPTQGAAPAKGKARSTAR